MAPPLIHNQVQRRQIPSPDKPKPAEEQPSSAPPSTPTTQPNSTPSSSVRPSAAFRPNTASPTPSDSPSPSPSPSASSSSSGGLNMTSAQSGIVITIVAIIGVVIFAFLSYVALKSLRLRYKDPKYLPGSWLKKKWENWDVVGYRAAGNGNNSNQARLNRVARSRANIEINRALDRQNSVRSVITLPPYREMAEMDLERTIGREGERDGLDTITQFPETADEEESRREERMQAMYELRLQRRAQRAAREARERGRGGSVASVDTTSATSTQNNNSNNNNNNGSSVSLTAMDMEAGGSGRTASELTAAILNDRTRRLSEVSYGEVGYARHDGSRVRNASSNRNPSGSDSQPLLADNASGAGRRSRAGSMLSLDTTGSAGRQSVDRRDSAEMLTGGDIGQTRLPPSYDGLEWGDAPPYMSPVSPVSRSDTGATSRTVVRAESQREGASSHPGLNVPLVRVTGASNPSSPMTPRDPNQRDGSL
ncbi:hypothetical protein H072_3821 [Dactylellina haptotyla CBS 200.50]|uniref:Uncharacterized protein n=1 Tax=Dactylellina haptotyla (strain CBS 200.50) TaxID=1284197 RepID=S8AGY0_DACHA|nr:hypothetical protein H072_3821 [Dactylellina haptotyla CBS 200.50]